MYNWCTIWCVTIFVTEQLIITSSKIETLMSFEPLQYSKGWMVFRTNCIPATMDFLILTQYLTFFSILWRALRPAFFAALFAMAWGNFLPGKIFEELQIISIRKIKVSHIFMVLVLPKLTSIREKQTLKVKNLTSSHWIEKNKFWSSVWDVWDGWYIFFLKTDWRRCFNRQWMNSCFLGQSLRQWFWNSDHFRLQRYICDQLEELIVPLATSNVSAIILYLPSSLFCRAFKTRFFCCVLCRRHCARELWTTAP